MEKFLKVIKNRWLVKGTSTLILVAVIIACYIGLNLLVDKVNVEDLDFTEKKLYSLSEETKSKVSELNNEVVIQLINMQNELYVKDYVKKYSNLNKNITVEEIDDLSSRIDLKTQYELEDTDSLIVIKSNGKEKTLTQNDLYTYDYTTYKQIDITEEAITNAIVETTIEKKPKIYILTGKTYNDPKTSMASIIAKLQDDSNEVEFLDILNKGNVPEDCDVLVITTLKSDLAEAEKDKILEYINNGGKLLILTSQNILTFDTPNLNSVISQYGMSIGFGAIFEQDESKMLSGSPEFIIEDVNASYMSNIDMNMKVCLIDAGKITFEEESKLKDLGVEYEIIASTGEESFVRTNFNISSYEKADQDSDISSNIVGAKVTKKISDDKASELIIFSNEQFATDIKIPVMNQYYMYAADLYNNKDVILNSISYLTKRTDTITIRKTNEAENYTVSAKENSIIQGIIFMTPGVIIIAGIIVWQIRRRKK